jgi:hypothetical protein
MTIATVKTTEPFDLTASAIERIACDAGAEDANVVRRILRAYWHSKERRARDMALFDEAVLTVENALERELPRDIAREIGHVERQAHRSAGH